MELLVSERSGWTKSFQIQKGVIRIGSASNNDVVLASPAVAPLHLQVFYFQQPERCKVMNLGSEIRVNRQGGQVVLASFANLELGAGDELLLDTYKLTFRLPTSAGVTRASASIEASLLFQDTVLSPDMANVGVLTIRNTGKSASCQFQVRLNGLPGDCFRIDPTPWLHPSAQEQFLIYLFHHAIYPKAGFHELKLSVSAPKTYPGEEVMIRQQIYVTSVFEPGIELQDDLPAREVVIGRSKPEGLPQPQIVYSPIESVPEPAPIPVSATDSTTSRPVERILKLEHNVTDDYWNEANAH